MELSCHGFPGGAPLPFEPPAWGDSGCGYQVSGYSARGAALPAEKATAFWEAFGKSQNGHSEAMGDFNQRFSSGPRPMVRGTVAAVNGGRSVNGKCPQCQLPIGELGYKVGGEGPLVHGECQAQLMLLRSKEEEEARLKRDAALKQARREKYAIGWRTEMVPADAEGLCCLEFDEASNTVRKAPAPDPAAAVNLEYLSLALQVRTRGGRDPMFSLDPKLGRKAGSPDEWRAQWQVKRFEPSWLAGTSAGEVMFQADVHLKELSMGEHAQPVMGMRSCFELIAEEGLDWCGREWYVVKRAEVLLSATGALVPFVEMGVEAREQFRSADHVEDAPLTRKDHPLVRYAEAFTRYFDVIAERKGVIYHLRELAKATVLAKFLVDSNVPLEPAWLEQGAAGTEEIMEIPQLWNERCHTSIQVRDGKILEVGKSGTCAKLQGVYGGAEFGTDRVQVVGFRRPVAAVLTEIPRGVDLNLDKFNLDAARKTTSAGGPSALQTANAKLPMGDSFWASIKPGTSSVFAEGDKTLFRDLFNPSLSDRRREGERFVPPEPSVAYLQKLRGLLLEEAAVAQARKERFSSEAFDMATADPLFPASWAPSADVARGEKPLWRPPQGRTRLSAKGMERVLKAEAPVFDKETEDGARFRIYVVSGVEVRTVQAEGGEEAITAVFSSRPPARARMTGARSVVGDEERVVKVLEYVEAAAVGCSYYLVLETDKGNTVTTERPADGSITWEENPRDLEMRNCLAKVTRSSECRGAAVREMRALRVVEARQRGSPEAYARAAFAKAKQGGQQRGMAYGGFA